MRIKDVFDKLHISTLVMRWSLIGMVLMAPNWPQAYGQFNVNVDGITITDAFINFTGVNEISAWNSVIAPSSVATPTTVEVTNEDFTLIAGECVTLNPGFEANVLGTGEFIATITPKLVIQPNEFKIGIFSSFRYKTTSPVPACFDGTHRPFTAVLDGGNPTSTLNVLSEDGFNITHAYGLPGDYVDDDYFAKAARLVGANDMQLVWDTRSYFKPDTTGLAGINVYNNSGISPPPYCLARPNFDDLLDNVSSSSALKSVIWGYQMTEEAAYGHASNPTDDLLMFQECSTTRYIDIPTVNVSNAIGHFKAKLNAKGVDHQKMIVMESYHNKAIHANSFFPNSFSFHPVCANWSGLTVGVNQPQDYINPAKMPNMPDVFFEGSYHGELSALWYLENYNLMKTGNGRHYLGNFESIDFAKTHVNEVHDVIGVVDSIHVHQNLSIPNANRLWFKAYTSIIHGVDGIWFWEFLNQYERASFDDSIRRNNLKNGDFHRANFPARYNNFVRHLARELRFLADFDLISTDPVTHIHTKTTDVDGWFIVPPITSYIFNTILAVPVPQAEIIAYLSEHSNESYGLRYTIRTNGREVIMIITNPLPVPIGTVTLNFLKAVIPSEVINNSVGVDVLFESSGVPVSSNTYKINRDANIDLLTRTVGVQHFIPYKTPSTSLRELDLAFGPFDVKVLRFRYGGDGLIEKRIAPSDSILVLQTPNLIDDLFAEDEKSIQSIEEQLSVTDSNTSIDIYPNPNDGHFTIRLRGDYGAVKSVRISDIQGRQLYKIDDLGDKLLDFDLSNHDKGIYLVTAYWDNGVIVRRLVIY